MDTPGPGQDSRKASKRLLSIRVWSFMPFKYITPNTEHFPFKLLQVLVEQECLTRCAKIESFELQLPGTGASWWCPTFACTLLRSLLAPSMGDAQDRRIHDSTSTMVIKTAVAPFRRAPSAEKMAATFVIFQVPNIASDLLIVGFKVSTRRSRRDHIAPAPAILSSSCRTKKKNSFKNPTWRSYSRGVGQELNASRPTLQICKCKDCCFPGDGYPNVWKWAWQLWLSRSETTDWSLKGD